MNATSATVATCRTCKGWTLIIMNCADDTADDLRDNAKSISDHVKRGRDINTVAPEALKAATLTPCKCPRPEKPVRGKVARK